MTTLSLYENMCVLSGQMVLAARANDWNRLVELERDMAGLRDRLRRDEPLAGFVRGPTLSREERERKIALIKRVLADDREVRLHTEPWLDSVRMLLGGANRGRNMRTAYGAFGA